MSRVLSTETEQVYLCCEEEGCDRSMCGKNGFLHDGYPLQSAGKVTTDPA